MIEVSSAVDTTIYVQGIGKQYRMGRKPRRSIHPAEAISNRLGRLLGKTPETADSREFFWALRDVSFEVKRGEAVGIIGRNGSGKSTLLKILARVVHPTEGRIEYWGSVSSILEVGTGFNPELSGRENVFLNGAILGMKCKEIERKFDDIVEFSEIEQFINLPVKQYSSGMKVRLAFSIAAHLEPEILILDEVLSVGDLAFQRKCLERMKDILNSGITVLFVSHSMEAIRSFCQRAIVLEKGHLVYDGDVDQAITVYEENNAAKKK